MNIAEELTKVVDFISNKYNIDKKWIFDKSRKQIYTLPRHICMYLIRTRYEGEISITDQSLFFKKDHSTLKHGFEAIRDRISWDKELEILVKQYYKEIFNKSHRFSEIKKRDVTYISKRNYIKYKYKINKKIEEGIPISKHMWDTLFKLYELQK